MNSLTLFLRQHRFALADTWQRLRRQPGAFLLNVLVLASAFALPNTTLRPRREFSFGNIELQRNARRSPRGRLSPNMV